MLLLALDTSDARGSVALLQDERVLQTVTHDSQQDYSAWVLPAVERLFSANHLKMQEVDVYAVAAGPGSFTGLRVGLTSVKAWSEVFGGKIAAVSRLEAIASQAEGQTEFVAAFVDAHREQVFGGLFRREAGALRAVDQEMVIAPDQFLASVNERTARAPLQVPNVSVQRAAPQPGNNATLYAGVEWVSMDPEKLTRLEGWRARAANGETVQLSSHVLAPMIGRLALQPAREGRFIDALALDAHYVRRSDAEIFWKGHAAG